MKKPFIVLFIVALSLSFAVIAGCTQQAATEPQNKDAIYQVSTFNALSQGVYDGSVTFGTLKEHGDTGLGTVNALDGEMIGLDGQFYQAKSDGSVVLLNDSQTTPFAMVTDFSTDLTDHVTNASSLSACMASLNGSMTNQNVMYVFEAHGNFSHVKVRSVPAQQKPYPVLTDAIRNQSVFDYYNVTGTIVGFWFPEYMAGVNVYGYHFHFITDDRTEGGHLLDCSADNLTFDIDETRNFTMALPEGEAFGNASIGQTNQTAVNAIEK